MILNKYNTQELNFEEKKQINGGVIDPVTGTVLALAALAVTTYGVLLTTAYYFGYAVGRSKR